jgi:hypothetical protein
MSLAGAADQRRNPSGTCFSCDDLRYNTCDDDGTPLFTKSVRFFDLRESAEKGCPSCSMICAAYTKFQSLSDDHSIALSVFTGPSALQVFGPDCHLEYHVLQGELDPA